MIKIKFKKFTAIALVIAMTFSMAGCGKNSNSTSAITQHENVSTRLDAQETADTNQEKPVEDANILKAQEAFESYLQESFEEAVTTDTITLHYTLAHPENYGITMDKITLGEFDLSEEALAEDKKELEEDIKELEGFDYELLTEDQQLTYDVLYNHLETELLSYDNPYLYEPFAYISGLQTNLPITMSEYTFYDEEDVKDYIELLNLFPDYYQKCLDFEKIKSEKGFFMSDINADEVIRQCQDYIADPENNLLIATFNDRIDDVPGMTPEKIEDYKKQNYDAVMNAVIPAYENVIDTFTSLKGTATNDMGLAHYEGGKEYYEYLLKSVVGTDKTPEEIIKMLESEIAVAQEEEQRIINGGIEGVIVEIEPMQTPDGEDFKFVMCSSNTTFTEGRFSLEETIEILEEMCVDKFPEIPEINYTVSPVHESLEGNVSPAFFMCPPIDEYQSNSIYTDESLGAAYWNTIAHEGIPGHMYQYAYFLSNDPEPMRYLLRNKGYIEGWATYVEFMSFDYYDEYTGESYIDLNTHMNRSALLLFARIDIGVNYEGWSLEEACDYIGSYDLDICGVSADGVYDYVISEPGNYQMYALGMIEIENLKEYTQQQLGEKFDEVEFHKVVLDAGPCQLSILEDIVYEYVNEKK